MSSPKLTCPLKYRKAESHSELSQGGRVMDSQNKVARGKPELNDAELIGALLFLSALSKALAKDVLSRSTSKKNMGGACYECRKKTQHPRP